jgi:hypothetical protein
VGANFKIEYRTGDENMVANFLSRYQQDSSPPTGHVLLPRARFGPKALADIDSWFKKSAADPNIRTKLEMAWNHEAREKRSAGEPRTTVSSAPISPEHVLCPACQDLWESCIHGCRLCRMYHDLVIGPGSLSEIGNSRFPFLSRFRFPNPAPPWKAWERKQKPFRMVWICPLWPNGPISGTRLQRN